MPAVRSRREARQDQGNYGQPRSLKYGGHCQINGPCGDHQARALLHAPDAETVKGKRDRAILSTLLYHGLRREELCLLKVRDLTARRGVQHLRVHGKGGKTRYLPLHPGTAGLINDYLEALGPGQEASAPLFRPVKNNVQKRTATAMTADGVYKLVQTYADKIGLSGIERLGANPATTSVTPVCT